MKQAIVAILVILLTCCKEQRPIPEAEQAISVTTVPDTLPAPVSVAVTTTQQERVVDPVGLVAQRLRQIGAGQLLVVSARVEELFVSERVLPQVLLWGEISHITTTLTLRVLETYCGPVLKTVRASYVGGQLPNGKLERTEHMPKDLVVGEEHIFFLRKIADEYFLELGREDMLRKDVQGQFRDASFNVFTLSKLKGVCP